MPATLFHSRFQEALQAVGVSFEGAHGGRAPRRELRCILPIVIAMGGLGQLRHPEDQPPACIARAGCCLHETLEASSQSSAACAHCCLNDAMGMHSAGRAALSYRSVQCRAAAKSFRRF
ncbi:hypothetical protein WJX73_007602 [Symbiochloris irregularis]|uniref:Uncharacterized protein n=1 Tax=Symbiochloris irregularis TaxID=706552 RepID=A0AAW1P715_9CHLO